MADFVAVIRKAVDNLSENTPENRAKVYDKARAAIRRQLEAINPKPSDDVIARQLDKLNAAIKDVESEHAEAVPADEEETDRLMAELEALVEHGKPIATPAPAPAAPSLSMPVATPVSGPRPAARIEPSPESEPRRDQAASIPATSAQTAPVSADVATPAPHRAPPYMRPGSEPMATVATPQTTHAPRPSTAAVASEAPAGRAPFLADADHDDAFGLNEVRDVRPAKPEPRRKPMPAKKRGGLGWLLVAALLLLVAGAGYAAWSQRDALTAMFGAGDPTPAPADSAATTPAPAPAPAPTETAAATPEDTKFTQRLNADGTETDPGPAPDSSDPGPVEGRSVAALTDTGPIDTGDPATSAQPGEDEATNGGETAGADTAAPAAPDAAPARPIGVSQKMFLYEERLDQQSPAVTDGAVVWSQVEETDAGGRPDVAIRGEITAGTDGFSALLTIKRNLDRSLPASHIIEIVFALPPGFPGGAVDQVQRINMKQTEQDQGAALIAVPAQITPDFYMVALNDLKEAVDTNLQLMRERSWIDIPIVYSNGRRALITLEKGASGSEVFTKVLDAWSRG